MAIRIVVSYKAIDQGHGPAAVGLLAISFSVIPLLLAMAVGKRIDRTGGRRDGIAGALVMTLASVSLVVGSSLIFLIVASAVFGLGQLICIVSQQATIARTVPAREHPGAFGRYNIFTSVGQVVGPVIVTGLASTGAAGSTGPVIAALFGALTLLCCFAIPRAEAAAVPAGGAGQAEGGTLIGMQNMGLAMVVSMSAIASMEIVLIYLPVWGEQNGVPQAVVGILLSVRAASTIVGQLIVRPLLDRVGRAALLRASFGVAAAAMALLPVCNQVTCLIPMVALGLTFGLTQPVTLSWVVALAGEGRSGAALGLRVTAGRVGQVLAPGVAAGLSWFGGTSAVFLFSSTFLLATALTRIR